MMTMILGGILLVTAGVTWYAAIRELIRKEHVPGLILLIAGGLFLLVGLGLIIGV